MKTSDFNIAGHTLKSCTLRESTITVPYGIHTIGEGAFKGFTSLEQVILPETVTVLEADAFKGCRRLREIVLPENLKEIGDYAFHRCHQLREIVLPPTVEKLGNCVFLYCDSLETVKMPGVKSLGLQVFLNDIQLKNIQISTQLDYASICDCFTSCGSLCNIEFSDGTSYRMENAVLAMHPQSGAPDAVRAIASDICRMMEIQDGVITKFLTNIKHVELAEGITKIGKSCFYDKKGIISVKFPSTLREIESRAFRNCINLERVEFADKQVLIHKDAFKNCTSLRYIRMENGQEYELTGLQCLEDMQIPDIVRQIHAQVLGNFFISGTTLLQYRGSEERVVIPDGVTAIGERAFAGNESVDRIILPESVEVIEEEAFMDCVVLQTVQFPQKLQKIGNSAFENCVKLIRAILPEALTVLGASSFKRCRTLNEVKFGGGMKEIGDMAFYGCSKMKEAVFPESLQRLGDMAFYQCLSLKEVSLPVNLEYLGSNLFTYSGIKSAIVKCSPKICKEGVFSWCGKLKKLTFEEGVSHIGNKFAFQCEKLTVVNLPSSVTWIGRDVFAGSRYLTNMQENKTVLRILLDGSSIIGEAVIKDEIEGIAGGAFYGNTQITSIKLPNGLKWIGPYAFCGCEKLQRIELPIGISELPEGIFAGCSSLQAVISQGKITNIAQRAFLNCVSLETISPLDECLKIGGQAFWDCNNLNYLEGLNEEIQPDAARYNGLSIGDSAFWGTDLLKRLQSEACLNSGISVLEGIIIDGLGCQGEVTVPEGITGIADYAFSCNENITVLRLPETLKIIGPNAFYGCKNLKSVHFGGPLLKLGRAAFEKCVSLTEMVCQVQTIEEKAFAWCTSLITIRLESTKMVDEGAFWGCSALKECVCGSLSQIGREAFSCCTALQDFDFSTVSRIGERAFERCECLEDIMLMDTVILAAHSFEDCGRLKRIRLQSSSGEENRLELGSYAFSGCSALQEMIYNNQVYPLLAYSVLTEKNIPEAVKRIYSSAMSCFSIDEDFHLSAYRNNGRYVSIPEGCRSIGNEVFRDKSRLEEIHIPDSVEYIGPRAFDKTLWLEQKRNVGKENNQPVVWKDILIDGSACRGEVALPADIRLVSGWAFANCIGLTHILFESDRIIVENHAFRNCIHLKGITLADGTEYRLRGLSSFKEELPDIVRRIFNDCYNCFKTDDENVLTECTGNITHMILPEGIEAVGSGVFKESNLLTHITFAKSTSIIRANAFEQCKWLEEVQGLKGVKRIERMAFSGCIRLKKIEELIALDFLGERAFENCTLLKEVILPEGLTEIPARAFYRCHELKRVVLPSTLKKIGWEAFAFCYKLTELYLPQGIETIEDRAFAWSPVLMDGYMQ